MRTGDWEERQTCQPQPNTQLASHMNARVKEVARQLPLYCLISNTKHLSPSVGDKHLLVISQDCVQYSVCDDKEKYWQNKGTDSHQVTCSW